MQLNCASDLTSRPTKSVTVTPWQSKDAGSLPIMIGGWLKVERGGGGDAKDSCKHYHPSLSQSIYQGPGCTFGRILAPDSNFMPKPMLHQVVMPYTILISFYIPSQVCNFLIGIFFGLYFYASLFRYFLTRDLR